jgi:hypothetical protein
MLEYLSMCDSGGAGVQCAHHRLRVNQPPPCEEQIYDIKCTIPAIEIEWSVKKHICQLNFFLISGVPCTVPAIEIDRSVKINTYMLS